jgi:polysaccharide transporter, PST family
MSATAEAEIEEAEVVGAEVVAVAAAADARTDTLAASIVILLSMTVLQRLIGFGRGVLFCRWLDPEQLGQWDVAFSFLNLAAPLAVLGLPGSFGRYFEYYRCRQQLRPFLRRTTIACALTGIAAVAAIALARHSFSELIFGRPDRGDLVLWVTACLAAVIVHNFLVCIFMAARMYRVVTALQFMQSLLFALISIGLCFAWQPSTASAVVGFGLSALLCIVGSYPFLRRVWHAALEDPAGKMPQQTFWAKLLPFAAWVWVTNLLSNLFDVVDRYMLVHYSGLNVDEALRQVGYYHSSRLIPLLIVAVAALLGTMITPHLSHDWEAGRRTEVCSRLNMILKTLSLAVFAGSVAVLFLAPLLFTFALGGKFTSGLEQLPFTLAYCTWFGTIAVAQNYLWCAEKAWLGSCSLLVGLLVNVTLDLVLLPRLGLHGAVLATTAANFVALSLVYLFSWRLGMRIHRGTWLLSAAPIMLWFGPGPALAALVALVVVAVTTNWLFHRDEKQHLATAVNGFAQKLKLLPGVRRMRWPAPVLEVE